MLKLNDKSKKKYHTNIKRGTFEVPLLGLFIILSDHPVNEF